MIVFVKRKGYHMLIEKGAILIRLMNSNLKRQPRKRQRGKTYGPCFPLLTGRCTENTRAGNI